MLRTYAYLHHRTFPYYKVQLWDEVSLCWRDVQRTYSTRATALAAMPAGKTARLMRIDEAGRTPEEGAP